MVEIDVCVTISAAILGVGYPLLLDVVSKLENKYNSHTIVETFKSEPVNHLLTYSIILSIASAFLVLFNRPPLFDFGKFNFLVDNSASLFMIFFTIILIIIFFLFIFKVLMYYSKDRFTKYVIKIYYKPRRPRGPFEWFTITKPNKPINPNQNMALISDLMLYAIERQDRDMAETLSRFVYDAFLKERQKCPNKPVEYPKEFYELTYRTTEALCIIHENRLLFLESRSAGAIWLIGEYKDFEISDTTYKWLWRILLLPVNYKKDNMLMSFWELANQFYSYNLPYIHPEYSTSMVIVNDEQIIKRNKERADFLEFTHALGGLLLYKRRYSCISRMFSFTNSIPPTYELLPNSMDQVIQLYIKYRDPYENNYPWISTKYYFPDLEGLTSDYTIKNWICTYIGLLLIRQYTIVPYLITMEPLTFPRIPETQQEKRIWIDNLDYLKKIVEDIFSNKELIETLKYSFLSKEWCNTNNKIHPVDFIDQLKERVIQEYTRTEIEQSLSAEKIDNFNNTTKNLLGSTIRLYDNLKNITPIAYDYKELFIHGERAVIDKSAFAIDQDSENLNYDSFLAEATSNKFQRGMSEIFFSMKTKTYLFDQKDIFTAIGKLIGNRNDLILVGFGNFLEYYIDSLQIPSLTKNSFKNCELYNFGACNYQLTAGSIFILTKNDLPNIEQLEIEKEQIEKYDLQSLDKELNLYASVQDLFIRKDLHQEFTSSANERDLNKSVLLNIIFKTRVRWKKDLKVIQIRSYSKHQDRGLPNDFKDLIMPD